MKSTGKRFLQAVIATSVVVLLSACGGGGGGGGGGSNDGGSSTPAPSVTLSFSQPKIAAGQSSTLTWTSTNAASCTASGAWSGAQGTSGTATETPTSGGAQTFTLTCSGAGGQTTQSATLVVPIPVQASSYLNKIVAANAIGPQPLPAEVTAGNAVAFGDFFQDGTYSMVTHTCGDTNCGADGSNGTIHFYKMINGQWLDHTSDILSNNVGCLHPRKAIVADFNGDGKPDVLFACHGLDQSPFPGEAMHMLLSQSNGTYRNVQVTDSSGTPFTGFFHSASAADFNGKGFDDVVVVDNVTAGTPYFLKNNGDGTFAKDTRLPAVVPYSTTGTPPVLPCTSNCLGAGIFTAELIDFNNTGKFDLFLGGNTPDTTMSGNWVPTIFRNNGDNTYSQSNVTELPYDTTHPTVTLDVLSINGVVYTTSTSLNASGSYYGFSEIQKIVGSNLSPIWVGNKSFSNGSTWLNWIIPYQGKIDSLNSAYGVSVAE
ncbi:VCBS repeat-containing protein [Paraburkholderia sp. MPAMCS5]|uniref:FG-GAP repeat domain-containing protein n=1 Tax=Paraburkholderia sp. MPAMCS5 TaxID=3112563 RepID=UPI002E174DC8|nr:VCBS repeat-containing protein [Paraburkholderia sp. MPAMCS5]